MANTSLRVQRSFFVDRLESTSYSQALGSFYYTGLYMTYILIAQWQYHVNQDQTFDQSLGGGTAGGKQKFQQLPGFKIVICLLLVKKKVIKLKKEKKNKNLRVMFESIRFYKNIHQKHIGSYRLFFIHNTIGEFKDFVQFVNSFAEICRDMSNICYLDYFLLLSMYNFR